MVSGVRFQVSAFSPSFSWHPTPDPPSAENLKPANCAVAAPQEPLFPSVVS
ncbi:hypothetical protein D1AOALGA4SA_2277 [Olavius algarvensis Delta 1 endosymbiont]|nr:hypothetical protein D1AOALGA4SA_2277 [Olavius algarvensis Delta 1 endosymbiont]